MLGTRVTVLVVCRNGITFTVFFTDYTVCAFDRIEVEEVFALHRVVLHLSRVDVERHKTVAAKVSGHAQDKVAVYVVCGINHHIRGVGIQYYSSIRNSNRNVFIPFV